MAVDRLSNDADGCVGDHVPRELVERRPFGRIGVRCAAEHATGRAAQKIDQDVVVFDAPVRIVEQQIQYVHDRADIDLEASFFANLTYDRGFDRLAELDSSSRQAPLALEWLVTALDQQDAIAVEDDRTNPDDRLGWILPHVPIT